GGGCPERAGAPPPAPPPGGQARRSRCVPRTAPSAPVPGNADVWNRVQTPTRRAGIAARLGAPLISLRATLRARDADRRDASGPHPDASAAPLPDASAAPLPDASA